MKKKTKQKNEITPLDGFRKTWTQQVLFNDIRILLIKGIAVISKLIEERTKRNPLSEVNPLIRGYDFFELLLRKFIILTIFFLFDLCKTLRLIFVLWKNTIHNRGEIF